MSERLTTLAVLFLGIAAIEVITGWIVLLWCNKSVPESMNNLAFTVVGALGGIIGSPVVRHVSAAIGAGAQVQAASEEPEEKS